MAKARAKKKVSKKTGPRQPFMTAFVGVNGTGKSTKCKNLIIPKIRADRALIVTPDDTAEIWREYELIDTRDRLEMQSFTGIRTAHVLRQGKKKIFPQIVQNYSNGTLILDDCRPYIKSNIENSPGLYEFLVQWRHKNIEPFFLVHTPTQLPPELWGYMKYCWLSKTGRLINPNSFNINEPDKFLTLQKAVNNQFKALEKKGDDSHLGFFKCIKL